MAAIDLNRTTAGVYLTPEQSDEIWTETLKQSAVTQLATKVALPGRGSEYDTLTDTGAASWVGETGEIAVDRPKFGSKIMKPFKLAKIIPVSNEFVRDKSALWNTIKSRASQAIAQGIDETFLTGVIGLPSNSNVDSLADAQTVSIGKGAYKDFAAIATTVLEHDGDFNGVALSPHGLSKFITATDANGRPLLVAMPGSTDLGSFFGGRVVKSPWGHVAAVAADSGTGQVAKPEMFGVAGDWTQAIYGTVEGIKMKVSDQATITDNGTAINLWQRDMIGFLVEAEIGFVVKDKTKFVTITA